MCKTHPLDEGLVLPFDDVIFLIYVIQVQDLGSSRRVTSFRFVVSVLNYSPLRPNKLSTVEFLYHLTTTFLVEFTHV